MEFLAEYGLFLAKLITVAVIIVAVLLVVLGSASHSGGAADKKGSIRVKKINDRFDEMRDALRDEVLEKSELKKLHKQEKKKEKERSKAEPDPARKRLYVLEFIGDIKASGVAALREEITAILTIARPQDEVLVCLESAGGMVHTYGLAASQLQRIRNKDIPLTIVVDKVAASGGYMMACVANRILAAPFAILGSVGVVAQIPNFNRLLKKNSIDVELLTAGEYKRTLTMFGENTEKGRHKFIEDLEETHDLFKDFIQNHRIGIDMEQVATGEVWYGQRAIDYHLIDELKTSDEYLVEQASNADIYTVSYEHKKTLPERLGLAVEKGAARAWTQIWSRLQESRFIS